VTIFAIDTNLLVYAHNTASNFHQQAVTFLEKVLNERDEDGNLKVCIPTQVLMEFVHVVTWQRLENPLSLSEALLVVEDYVDTGITIIYQRQTQLRTFLDLLSATTTRKKVFDVALAATLQDNGVSGLYTANIADFQEFDFLEVTNPLESK
jgi:hypothetical protein